MTGQVCWRSECRNGCYYGPDACSLADHAAVPCPAPPTELWISESEDEGECGDCSDTFDLRDGCQHDGQQWCASCFPHQCRECADALRDDMAAEAKMDRDR